MKISRNILTWKIYYQINIQYTDEVFFYGKQIVTHICHINTIFPFIVYEFLYTLIIQKERNPEKYTCTYPQLGTRFSWFHIRTLHTSYLWSWSSPNLSTLKCYTMNVALCLPFKSPKSQKVHTYILTLHRGFHIWSSVITFCHEVTIRHTLVDFFYYPTRMLQFFQYY